jgi:hypothetical protein
MGKVIDLPRLIPPELRHTNCDEVKAFALLLQPGQFEKFLKGGGKMKKFAIALALIFGLNLVGSMIHLANPVAWADDEPEPKPEKPGD